MSLVAIIPARAGSKGIRKKNLALLNRKPMIQYTIEAAKESRMIDRIFVTTDDENVISLCQSLDIDVPYRRPFQLGLDTTPMVDTVEHALRWMEVNWKIGMPADVLLLQPTSPLRGKKDIEGAIRKYKESEADSLASVHKVDEHPYECMLLENERWQFLIKQPKTPMRRQEYPEYYYINGAIYLIKSKVLLEKRSFIFEGETVLYKMPKERGIDVDNKYQLKIAAALLSDE